MTWKGVGSFPSVRISVVKNLKVYVNLLLGGCFTVEHVLAKFCPLPCWIMAKMCQWKVGGLAAHKDVILVQGNTPSTFMPVQL